MASSCVHLLRLAPIHPYQQQTFRKPKFYLSSPHANLTSSLISAFCTFPYPLRITGQKHKLQFLSPKTLQYTNLFTSRNTIRKATFLCEYTTASENTPKFSATEICILVFVYIIPFLNKDLPTKFSVLKYVVSPVIPLLRFYQSIHTIVLILLLSLFIGFVRNKRKEYYSQAKVMDSVLVIASLVRPFLLTPDPSAFGFQVQLLRVLELLFIQTCVHEYLGAVQRVVHSCLKYSRDVVQWVVGSDASCPSTLAQIMEVVLKTKGDEGRREGKSLVLKLLRANNSLLSDVDFAKTCNKNILSSCQSCLNSLPVLFKMAENHSAEWYDPPVDEQISLETDNLLWLLDILVDRQAAEEFALMWSNQQELANLHAKTRTRSRHLVSCITTRLLVSIGNGEIFLAKGTRRLLLQTWFQPLVDDYSRLLKLESFDPEVVEENIERAILELAPKHQRSLLLAWYGCFLKDGENCPDLRKAFQDWCRRTFSKTPPHLILPP